jgi:membrane-bound serine protease (ClpP class)
MQKKLTQKLTQKLISFILFIYIFCFALIPVGIQQEAKAGDIYLLEIKGTITRGQAAFVERQLSAASADLAQAVIIELDTPGGLVEATLDLTKSFSASPIPVIVFVQPTGAIAASAGAFLLISADIAAMAPGTTVGAAMPVTLSPDGGSEKADEKTINFLAGHMKSIARQKGRSADLAEKFVTENLALDAIEAQEKGVSDLVAENLTVLLEKIDGFEGEKDGHPFVLNTAGASILEKDMIPRERLQDKVSDPQVAYLLLIAGALGIYFGLGMAGTFILETLGGIALLLGIYGMGLFDTNTAGIIFIVLGLGLLVVEVFTAGFGILGIGGGVSLLIGSVLLPSEPLMAPYWYPRFMAIAVGAAVGVCVLSFLIATMIIRSRRSWKGRETFFGPASKALVVEELSPYGTVKMRGELWKALSHNNSTIPQGAEVEIVKQQGLTLIVKERGSEKNPALNNYNLDDYKLYKPQN